MDSGFGGFGNSIVRANNKVNITEEIKKVAESLDPTYVRLSEIAEEFADGNVDSQEIAAQLSIILRVEIFSDFQRLIDENPDTEELYVSQRTYIDKTLKGIELSVATFRENVELEETNSELRSLVDFFQNPDNLMQFLDGLLGGFTLQETYKLTAREGVTIAPEHLYYIRNFGYPNSGVWDTERFIDSLNGIVSQWQSYGFSSQGEAQAYIQKYSLA